MKLSKARKQILLSKREPSLLLCGLSEASSQVVGKIGTNADFKTDSSNKYRELRQVALRDTAGQASYDMLLNMSCHNVDVLLLCFHVSSNAAKIERSLRRKWIPSIGQHYGGVPVVLVGIQDRLEVGGGGEQDKDMARTMSLIKPEELVAKEIVQYSAHWRVGDNREALNIVCKVRGQPPRSELGPLSLTHLTLLGHRFSDPSRGSREATRSVRWWSVGCYHGVRPQNIG